MRTKIVLIRALRGLGIFTASLLCLLTLTEFSPVYDFRQEEFSGKDIFNPYAGLDSASGWHKACIHTHTRVKGPLNECPCWPDEVIGRYRAFRYDVTALTNHNLLTVQPLDSSLSRNFYEHGWNIAKVHYNVFGCGKVRLFDHFLPVSVSQRQHLINMLAEDGSIVQFNHPLRTINIPALKSIMRNLEGYRLIEMDRWKDPTQAFWDEALSHGRYSFCTANDDNHDPYNMVSFANCCEFFNCRIVSSGDLGRELDEGCFYAAIIPDCTDKGWDAKGHFHSNLPYVKDIGARGDTLFIRLSEPAESIETFGKGHTVLARAEDSPTLEYILGAGEPYARFSATFHNGMHIYCNPFARFDRTESQPTPFKPFAGTVDIPLTVAFNLAVLAVAALFLLIAVKLFRR